MKIFSLNLWNLNDDYKGRMQIVDRWVKKTNPDIVFLQEVSPEPGSARLQSDLIFAGDQTHKRVYASQYQWDDREEGLAILARYPVLATESMILPEAEKDGQRRVLMAVLDIAGRRVLAANTHLAFRIEQDDFRLEQAKHLVKCLVHAADSHQTEGIILAGDFNAEPQSSAITEVTQGELSLVDIFASSEDRKHCFTASSSNPYISADDTADRWIDYIFTSTNLKTLFCSLALDGKEDSPFASDHFALEAEIELS